MENTTLQRTRADMAFLSATTDLRASIESALDNANQVVAYLQRLQEMTRFEDVNAIDDVEPGFMALLSGVYTDASVAFTRLRLHLGHAGRSETKAILAHHLGASTSEASTLAE